MLSNKKRKNTYLAAGFANPELSESIAAELSTQLDPVAQKVFPNTELYTRFEDSVRGKHVFLLQSHVSGSEYSVNDAIMQQCLMADAARSSSAKTITAVAPNFGYGRQDRKSKGREPIAVRAVINMLAAAGVSRFVTVDMHSPQSQAIFDGPFDHLTAQPLLREAVKAHIEAVHQAGCDVLVVAPDAGASKLADIHRRKLGAGLLHMAKSRDKQDSSKITREDVDYPEVEGKICVVFDDMIDTAGTLTSAAEELKRSGASAVYAAATHGIFSGPALERLEQSDIDCLFVSDTHDQQDTSVVLGDHLQVVSTARMIAQAICEIRKHGSVSNIFDDQNHM